ncbi:MAG TPA: fimbria/pilus outer membrane usher protein, partial [Thermoanaerobaculia bacterium]|nr:fimbria/pilus outer membrane usher protein [Thermoanaerobaculia bacterium]
RLVFGDATVFGDELGGSGIIGGATVARNFDLDPYFIRFPSMSLRGMAATPAQVEIYVNGVLVDRRSVPPGPFEIGNIPAASGTSAATVVVRDAFGREQTHSSSFYYSTSVLGRGLSEFTYSAGMVRNTAGSFDYDDPVLFALHRYGVTDNLTVGGRLEATGSLVSGGPSVALASSLGEIDLKLAGSSSDGRQGAAAHLGFRRLSRRTNFGGTIRLRSREYVNFSMPVERDRPLEEATLFASYLPWWGNIGLQWTSANMRDSGERRRLALLTNIVLGDRANLLFSAGRVEENDEQFGEYFVGFSIRPYRTATLNVSAQSREGVSTVSTELQRPTPVGTGWGYRVHSSTGTGETTSNASVQYQNDFGRYEVGIDPQHPGDAALSAAGAVVYQAGKIVPTRPVAQSFALVRVPGVAGVRVYLSNQLVGLTDRRGELLVPNLLPYYGNRLRIDDRDVPMTHDIQVIEKTIAPPPRGGALVVFPAREVRAAIGSVVVKTAAGEVVPAYGEIRIEREGTVDSSPIGGQGDFYFENVSAGSYDAVVEYEGGTCSFVIRVPTTSGDVIEIGRVVCSGAAP